MKNWMIELGAKLKKLSSEKVLTLTETKLNEILVKELTKEIGYQEAAKRIFEGAWQLGHEFMLELSPMLKPDVTLIKGYGHAAWVLFAGKKPDELIYREIQIGDYKVHELILRDYDSPFSRNIRFKHKFCMFPAGAYQGASQTWAYITKQPYKTIARETKCKAVGDPYCELTLWVVPEDMPEEEVRKARPEWFEEIPLGFKLI